MQCRGNQDPETHIEPEKLSLGLNLEKTDCIKTSGTKSFDYLGYAISASGDAVSISKKKIGKTKKRIILSIKQYLIDKNFPMLYARIRYLSSNVLFKKDDRKIIVGFRYSYSCCTDAEIKSCLKELDVFYRSILFSKRFSVSVKMRNFLSNHEFNELKKISFLSGYEKNIVISYLGNPVTARKEIAAIKEAWLYE